MTREDIKRCIRLFLDSNYASDNHSECTEKLLSEYDKQIRAEERKKVLNAVYDCGWNCEVHSRMALNDMVEIELEELGYEITTRHKDKD